MIVPFLVVLALAAAGILWLHRKPARLRAYGGPLLALAVAFVPLTIGTGLLAVVPLLPPDGSTAGLGGRNAGIFIYGALFAGIGVLGVAAVSAWVAVASSVSFMRRFAHRHDGDRSRS